MQLLGLPFGTKLTGLLLAVEADNHSLWVPRF